MYDYEHQWKYQSQNKLFKKAVKFSLQTKSQQLVSLTKLDKRQMFVFKNSYSKEKISY